MNRMLLKCLFACAAFALTASETLPAVELTHRWSFNGDYSDSVGGADAANNVFLSWTFGTTLSKNQLGSKVQGGMKGFDPIV